VTNSSSSSFDYCSISSDHTMCKYSGPSKECKAQTVKRELSDKDKQAIVDKHNELRRKVAKGLEKGGKPGPQPAASDMLLMVWDDELATIAQRWADQCTFGHDSMRDTKEGYAGQNAALSSSSAEMSDDALAASYADATTSWYDEVSSPGFNKDNINPFVFDSGSGHYSQVVWGSSGKVGCGSVYYKDGSGSFPYSQIIICNYFAGGNLMGGTMYNEGKACSACPAEHPTCSDGLCKV